ncbi:TonB-dependent receptor [Steroidobacter sp.]|uniref:TonB-dependent receptor n=1 Tax=Steroidobacter sp. TaxID=1978227 RepID=UPI002ED8B264
MTSAVAGADLAHAQTVTPPEASAADTSSPSSSASGEGELHGVLEDVVVTAQRRSERLQDVPIAVTALSGEALASKGLASTFDIVATTPGLTFVQAGGSAAPRIRGVGSSAAQGGNENAVATYVDGVYYVAPYGTIFSLNNIEQIAVLKGPQGTLFGRNATGGLIQVTTRDPEQDFGAEVSASYGNRNTRGGSLYVTGGLTDQVAADLAVYYDDQMDGFGKNLFNGQDVNKSKNVNVRSKLKWDLGDDTTVKLSGDYGTRDTGLDRRPLYGSLPSTGVPFTGGPHDVNSNVQPFFKNRQYGGSLEVVHHFDAFDLIGISAYRYSRSHLEFDVEGLPQKIIDALDIGKDHQFSQEIQLVSTAPGPFSWQIGGYYFRYKGGYDRVVIDLPPATQDFQSYTRARSPAIYGQATYEFVSDTSLTLGLRYTSEDRYQDTSGTLFMKATNTLITQPPLHDKITASRPTWRIALDHNLNPDTLVYASYNRGFKSGGFNTGIYFPALVPFAPESLDAYEIGIKSDSFDRRVRINASGYYYDYSNIQLVSYFGGQVTIRNAAQAGIYGLDADITVKPVDRLTLTAGVSYIHDRLGTYTNAQVSTPLPAGGNAITQGIATGNKLPSTPDWTLDVGADYVIPLMKGEITASAHYFHSDGWFAEPDNRLKQPAYDTLNASVKWDLLNGLSLSAWGKNLTDELYAVTLQTQSQADILVAAPGRSYGITVAYKY